MILSDNWLTLSSIKQLCGENIYFCCTATTAIINSSILTSTPVPQQVAVDILDVGVDGGPTGDTAGGHVGVCLWVDILEAFPGNTRAELWESRLKRFAFQLLSGHNYV